jgi:FkbM family methyltransferase
LAALVRVSLDRLRRAMARDAFADQARLLGAAGSEARVIIDGGAYIGELTARYLKEFPRAHVWAIEPAPANMERLRLRFSGEPRVTVVAGALAEADGEQMLALNDADMTHSLLPLDPTSPYADYPVASIGETPVATVSLDSLCRKHDIDRVAILKLDVQGGEAAVLERAA